MRQIESNLQQACKRWFDLRYPSINRLLFAVPNGGYRWLSTARRMKAEGVVAGVADMILLVKNCNYGALCIEFKTKTGTQSSAQKEFQQMAEKGGNRYVIVRSFEDFHKEVSNYLTEYRFEHFSNNN